MRIHRVAWQFLAVAALSIPAVFAQDITVYSSGKLAIGGTRQLTAYVPLSPNTVTWSVNGVNGGNSTFGTVSASGFYTAPAAVPMNNAVIVRATSTAYPAKAGDVTMMITQPQPQLWSIYPTSIPAGNFTITLNGANFNASSVVKFGGAAIGTTVLSATGIRAMGTATAAQAGTQVSILVTNTGLGEVSSPSVNLKITAPASTMITVTVTPSSGTVAPSGTRQFSSAVANTTNTGVTWSVNGVAGGNGTVGVITTAGLYTAPAAIPSPATVTVRATSAADATISGAASVSVQAAPPAPVTVTVSPASVTVAPSVTQAFAATVTGNSNTSVTWSVNGVASGNATVGSISAAGLYTAPVIAPSPASVTIRATSVANTSSSGTATANIVGPPNPGTGAGTGNLTASRFLEHAAFGPTPAELARVKQVGIDAWLTEQFNTPETAIPLPTTGNSDVRAQLLSRLSMAPDQLRQRVAYALSQLIVISMNKNNYPDEIVPYLRILSKNAFGNYRTLLYEISTSSQMGKYLDMANSTKPTAGGGANENYAREAIQLFTIGLYALNPDGSQKLDALGKPIATYGQTDVQQVALAFTGWTYPNNNWEDFSGPLQPREINHDTRQKSFLGCSLPAGQTTTQDMNATLDCLFNHPNGGPFLATRLIRSLTVSNPSPAYIARVSAVYDNNGASVRGDLKAVVKAILTDPEARNDTATPTSGRLKEPIYHIVSFVRALNGNISPTNQQSWMFSQMAQAPLVAPSVFSFYSPLYRVPKSPLFGPEFQIYTPTESVLRGNYFWAILSNPGSDFPIDLTPFSSVAGNTTQLIDAVDQALLYGRMPQAMRQSLANAITAQPDNASRMRTALYLTALSGLYAVQY